MSRHKHGQRAAASNYGRHHVHEKSTEPRGHLQGPRRKVVKIIQRFCFELSLLLTEHIIEILIPVVIFAVTRGRHYT